MTEALHQSQLLPIVSKIQLPPSNAGLKNTLTVWACTTYGDQMPLETVVGRTFEEVAEPCRQSLREMEWIERHGTPIETAEEIADAWGETFRGFCVITSHEI